MPVTFGKTGPNANHRDTITQQPGPFYNGNPSSSIWGNPPSSSSLWLNMASAAGETYQSKEESASQQVGKDESDPDKVKPVFVFGLSSSTSSPAASSPRARKSAACTRSRRHGVGNAPDSAFATDGAAGSGSQATTQPTDREVPIGASRRTTPFPEPMIMDDGVTVPMPPPPFRASSFTFGAPPASSATGQTALDPSTFTFGSSRRASSGDGGRGAGVSNKKLSAAVQHVSPTSVQSPSPFLSPLNVSPAMRITPVPSPPLQATPGLPVPASNSGPGIAPQFAWSAPQMESEGRLVGEKDLSRPMHTLASRESVVASAVNEAGKKSVSIDGSGTTVQGISGGRKKLGSAVSNDVRLAVGNDASLLFPETVVFNSQPPQVGHRTARASASRGLQTPPAGSTPPSARVELQAQVPEVLQQLRENYGWASPVVEDELSRREGFAATGIAKSVSSDARWGAAERARAAVVPSPIPSSMPDRGDGPSSMPSKGSTSTAVRMPGEAASASNRTSRGGGDADSKNGVGSSLKATEGSGIADLLHESTRLQLGGLGINSVSSSTTKKATGQAAVSEQQGSSASGGTPANATSSVPFVFGASTSTPSSARAARPQGSFLGFLHSSASKPAPPAVAPPLSSKESAVHTSTPPPSANSISSGSAPPPPIPETASNPYASVASDSNADAKGTASSSDRFVFSVAPPSLDGAPGAASGASQHKKLAKSTGTAPTRNSAPSTSLPKPPVATSPLLGAEREGQSAPALSQSFLSSKSSLLSPTGTSTTAASFVFGAKPPLVASSQGGLTKAKDVAAATAGLEGLSLGTTATGAAAAAPPIGSREPNGTTATSLPTNAVPISTAPLPPPPVEPAVSPISSSAATAKPWSEAVFASEFVTKLQFTGFTAGEESTSSMGSKAGGGETARRRTHTIHHAPLSQQRKKSAASIAKGTKAHMTSPPPVKAEDSVSTPVVSKEEVDDAPSPMDVSPIQPSLPEAGADAAPALFGDLEMSTKNLDLDRKLDLREPDSVAQRQKMGEMKAEGVDAAANVERRKVGDVVGSAREKEVTQTKEGGQDIYGEEVGSPGTGEVVNGSRPGFRLDDVYEKPQKRLGSDRYVFGEGEGVKRAAGGEEPMVFTFGAQEEKKRSGVTRPMGPRRGVRKVVRATTGKRVEEDAGATFEGVDESPGVESLADAHSTKEGKGAADGASGLPRTVAANREEEERHPAKASKVEGVEPGLSDDSVKAGVGASSSAAGGARSSALGRDTGIGARAKVGVSFSSTFPGRKTGSWVGRPGPGIGILGHLSGVMPPSGSNSNARATSGASAAEPAVAANSQIPSAKMGERKEGATAESVASKVSEMDCNSWRLQGNAAYAVSNFLKAEECYSQGVSIVSNNMGEMNDACQRAAMLCYSNRAATRMAIGRMREALADCMRAIAVDPNFSRVHLRVAICHLALGEREQARRLFAECTQQRSGDEKDVKAAVEAAEGLRKVATLEEKLTSAASLLDKEPAKALPLIKEALSISPHSEMLLEMKSRALLMTRQYEEVVKLCEQTLELAERNQPLNLAPPSGPAASTANGSAASNAGPAALTPVRLWRWRHGARARYHLGKLEEALPMLEALEAVDKEVAERTDAILLLPNTSANAKGSHRDSAELHTLIKELLRLRAAGNGAFQAGKHAEAMEHYTGAINLAGDSRSFNAILFCNRAATFQALNQIADALADCSRAIALDPVYTKAISRRATLCEMVRDYSQAFSDLTNLVAILERRVAKRPMGVAHDLSQARERLAKAQDALAKDVPVDHYLILGLESGASAADVKKAYRKAALRHHPDKVLSQLKGESAEGSIDEVRKEGDRLFKLIGEAHTVLSDVNKRATYDREEELRKLRSSTRMGAPDIFPHYSRSRSFFTTRDGYGYQQQRWRNEPDAAQPDTYARRRPRGNDFSADGSRSRNRGGFDWEET